MLSNVLGILIAFVTVILLLSMVVTGLVQATQAALRLRSRNLQQGIAVLLATYSGGALSMNEYRGHAAQVLNAPNLAALEKVDRGDSVLRRILGPKVSWAPPAQLAVAIAQRAQSIRAGSSASAPAVPADSTIPAESEMGTSSQRIEQDVVSMEPALRKRFRLFIRLWTILWSLIVAAAFQVNTPDLLSSFTSSQLDSKQLDASEQILRNTKSASTKDDHAPAQSSAESAQAGLAAFGIRFWGQGSTYYYDSNGGPRWQVIVGVLVTGILMSFGAPFWFQKLQFLASLRDQKAPAPKPDS